MKHEQTRYRPVMLSHGVQCTGSEYLINRPGYLNSDGTYLEWDENNNLINGSETITNTLGFTLASRGYDVWLINFRGTYYSLNHTRLDVSDPEFWRFSMDEMIQIDLPSMIDYILYQTNHSSLSYIGHSQANVLMLKPGQLVFQNMKNVRSVLSTICSNRMMRWICYHVYDLAVGYQTSDINVDRFPVHIYNIPSGASNDNAIHHMQTWKKGHVSHYDYGVEKNLKFYNQSEPPIYDVTKINSTNIAFFQSSFDRISSIEGNIQLKQELTKPLLEDYVIDRKDFDHMSFVWSKKTGI
ncbi:hypothetical protein BLA29_006503, partial [Euroglyphus maynei]